MKKINITFIAFWFIYLFMIVMIALGLLSCNSVKQATKHYEKAKHKNIVTVASLVRKDWPCVTTKIDTLISYKQGKTDTLIQETTFYADCPDTAKNAPKNSVIKVPVKVPQFVFIKNNDTVFLTQTKLVEDSAKIFVAQKETAKAQKDVDKYQSRANTKGWIIAVLISLFIIYILLTKTFKIL